MFEVLEESVRLYNFIEWSYMKHNDVVMLSYIPLKSDNGERKSLRLGLNKINCDYLSNSKFKLKFVGRNYNDAEMIEF